MARAARILAALALVLLWAGSAWAQAPGFVPAHNCDTTDSQLETHLLAGVKSLNVCRAREGIGPLHLPSNFHRLDAAEQLLVLVDLERVNRGIAPLPGLTAALDSAAVGGAQAGTDPTIPPDGTRAGSVWAGERTAWQAVYLWMYDDGPGAVAINESCHAASDPGCWGHRRILMSVGPGAAGGFADGRGGCAGVVETGYRGPARLVFSWRRELRYFAQRPVAEPLR